MPSSKIRPDHIVTVGVPVPGLGLLSYRAPGETGPPKGARVRVTVGNRVLTGCVVDPDAPPPRDGVRLKDIGVIDTDPFVPPSVVELALWVAEYYAAGPGSALALVVPPRARKGRAQSFRTVAVVSLAPAAADRARPGRRQAEALALLAKAPEGVPVPALRAAGIGASTIRSLSDAGLVCVSRVVVERDPFDEAARWTLSPSDVSPPALTDEQTAALSRLEQAAAERAFRPVLLSGVTGSGKTELYLRVARTVVASGRSVLVLVPEIALTPAAAGRFRSRFGDRVAIQHSALSPGERHDQWHRIRRGEVDVVVGTRSAVFTPLDRLGLIVVDEEHDGSYKQEEAPRYHGRDVAVMRGRMEHAMVVLGSATPSIESAANARSGRYDLVTLTRRVLDRPMAAVRVVDMRPEFAAQGADMPFSGALLEAIAARLERREQTVILLNRRGFATVVFCRQCGSTMECPNCSVSLTWHRGARRLRCHYCNHVESLPSRCAKCQGEYLEQSGFGTERLEAELSARFPDARLARVDRDTIRRRGAVGEVLDRVARGEVDILIGTQMIAKGHDFPAVTLVGVVSADVGLGMADFRAAERTFQLVTQVVGRAGRGAVPGEAIVQTLFPDHYSIRAAAAQDYTAFVERELDFRRKLWYPPAVGLVNIVLRDRTLDRAMSAARDLALLVRRNEPGLRVLGPAPAPLARLKGDYRAQLLVKSSRRTAMRRAIISALAERPDLGRRIVVDVDPVSVL